MTNKVLAILHCTEDTFHQIESVVKPKDYLLEVKVHETG